MSNARINLSKSVPLEKPLVVYIKPCNICNFRCEFCSYQRISSLKGFIPNILSKSTAEVFVNNIAQSFGRVNNIILTSAEALLNPNIDYIVKLCKSVADHVRMITNGSLLNRELSDALVNAGIDTVSISVNGLSSKEYRKRTGHRIDFDLFVENIRYLSEKMTKFGGVHIKIIDYMIKEPEKEAYFYEIFTPLGKLEVQRLVNGDSSIDFETIVGENYDFGLNLFGRKHDKDAITCPMAFYVLNICENGDVVPCCHGFLSAPILGNALRDSLTVAWRNSLNLQYKMLSRDKNIAHCKDCKYVMCNAKEDYLDGSIEELKLRYRHRLKI